MTPTEVAAKLRQFNEWRRDFDDKVEQPDSYEIGEAIDAAVEMIESAEEDRALCDKLARPAGRCAETRCRRRPEHSECHARALAQVRKTTRPRAAGEACEGDIEMIDTKELRRLAQAASHPATKGRWIRLFGERTVYDRMEDGCRGIPIVATDHFPPSLQEAAYLDFIAAANPAAITELLDRLEAAEKERVIDEQRIADLMAELNRVGHENDALRAKIAEMEQEEIAERVAAGVADLTARLENKDKELLKQAAVVVDLRNKLGQARAAYHELQESPTLESTDPALNGGWKLVPIEPTFEMLDKGSDQSDGYVSVAKAVWDAMIAAAPEAKP